MNSFASLIIGLILSAVLVSADADDKLAAPFHSQPAVDVSVGGLDMTNRDELRKPPLTIECWARLHEATAFNIIVASDPKISSQNWVLYTELKTGNFAFYTNAMDHGTGPHRVFVSDTPICDDAWHYLAVIYESGRARLYVDGKMIEDVALPPQQGSPTDGDIAVGQLVEGGNGVALGCNGLIQDVRISKGVRNITGMPSAPFQKDATTLELWPLNKT